MPKSRKNRPFRWTDGMSLGDFARENGVDEDDMFRQARALGLPMSSLGAPLCEEDAVLLEFTRGLGPLDLKRLGQALVPSALRSVVEDIYQRLDQRIDALTQDDYKTNTGFDLGGINDRLAALEKSKDARPAAPDKHIDSKLDGLRKRLEAAEKRIHAGNDGLNAEMARIDRALDTLDRRLAQQTGPDTEMLEDLVHRAETAVELSERNRHDIQQQESLLNEILSDQDGKAKQQEEKNSELAAKQAGLDNRVGSLDQRLHDLNERLSKQDSKAEQQEKKNSELAAKQAGLDDRVRSLDQGLHGLEESLQGLERRLGAFGNDLAGQGRRFAEIADAVKRHERTIKRYEKAATTKEDLLQLAERAENSGREVEKRSAEDLEAHLAEQDLRYPAWFLEKCMAVLVSGDILVIEGPTQTGKSELARGIAELYNGKGNNTLVQASESLTDVKFIGHSAGDWLKPDPPILLKAIRKCVDNGGRHWLIIDEFNRGDPNSYFNPLMGAYQTDISPAERWLPHDLPNGKRLRIPPGFRILATQNPFAIGVHFEIDSGMEQRFCRLPIPPVEKDDFRWKFGLLTEDGKPHAHLAGFESRVCRRLEHIHGALLEHFSDSKSPVHIGLGIVTTLLKRLGVEPEPESALDRVFDETLGTLLSELETVDLDRFIHRRAMKEALGAPLFRRLERRIDGDVFTRLLA